MSDNFIEEIKEEIRNDQIQRIWRDYGHVIVGALVAIIIATVGYIIWHNHKVSALNEQTITYEQILAARAEGKEDTEALANLKDSGSKGYQLLSSMMTATDQSASQAAKDLADLSEDSSFRAFYHDLAGLQAVMRKFDQTNGKELLEDLSDFDTKSPTLQAQALELKGYAFMKLNDKQSAAGAFRAAIEHPNATPSLVIRARAMLEML